MKLKYKILWFEDEEEVVQEDVGPQISSILVSLGFEPIITHKLNGEELETLLRATTYDLIVTDLNLGEYETGEELIKQIREGRILTEVLLYSAIPADLNRVVANKGWVERVSFCVGLGNLTKKLEEVVRLTVRKQQDVNNTRGLVIAETIDLEKKIETILLHYFDTENELLNEEKEQLVKEICDKRIESFTSHLDELAKVEFRTVRSLIEKDILTAANSFSALHSLLKKKMTDLKVALNSGKLEAEVREGLEKRLTDLKTAKDELNNFEKEILLVRNTLAHVEEEMDEQGIPFLKSINKAGTTILFNSEKYVAIRQDLRKHHQNLDSILEHLNAT